MDGYPHFHYRYGGLLVAKIFTTGKGGLLVVKMEVHPTGSENGSTPPTGGRGLMVVKKGVPPYW